MSLSFPETTRSQAHSAGSPHFTSQSPLTFQNPGRLRGFAGSALSWHLAASSLLDSGCFCPDYIFSLLPVSLRGPDVWSLGGLPVFPCSVFGGVAMPAKVQVSSSFGVFHFLNLRMDVFHLLGEVLWHYFLILPFPFSPFPLELLLCAS